MGLLGLSAATCAFLGLDGNQIFRGFTAGLIGLALSEGAYMAEIVRAGIQSVDPGQTEAASALGMSRGTTMRRIVLPQAMRVIIPPTGNETIAMLKDTSLLIAVPVTTELNFQLRAIGSRTFQIIPLAVASILWYLALSSVLMVGQYFLERRFSRGFGTRETRAQRVGPPRPRRGGHALTAAPDTGAERTAAPMVRAEGVHKSFGHVEVLKGIDLEVAPQRGHVRHRAVRLGQVDLPALHQPPGEDQRRPALGRRRSWSATGEARRQAARAEGQRGRRPAPGHRHGVPAVQPLPAHDRAGERRPRRRCR